MRQPPGPALRTRAECGPAHRRCAGRLADGTSLDLAPLTEHLNEDRDWSRVLSLGEQQRLAFARLLLHRPRIAYLDEATSATDEGLEHSLYALLRDELPGCILVSVAHRSTLDPFHTHRLELQGAGRWRSGPWGHVGCLCR
jgi:vitamin B12/bleomycin/antimicrobial peptide transport system ATP-binding/permease protein